MFINYNTETCVLTTFTLKLSFNPQKNFEFFHLKTFFKILSFFQRGLL